MTPSLRKPLASANDSWMSPAAMREVIESVVIAFVLAFLFRTFEAEAFVIPTGSMAPTLMGRHKDVSCEKCGFPYQVSASSEVDPRTGRRPIDPVTGKEIRIDVVAGTCPVCRHRMYLGSDNPEGNKHPSFTGDRILVAKFPYQFGDPQRWDVAVFRFPGGATTNYIKRIVGLPRETVRIRHGNLWVKRDGESAFTIARKPPYKVRAMLQPVYDNDCVSAKVIQQGWPARWAAQGPSGASGAWTSNDYRSFHSDGSSPGEVWLRYSHYVASSLDSQQLEAGPVPPASSLRPQLVTDFAAYNTEYTKRFPNGDAPAEPFEYPYESARGFGESLPVKTESLGLHWVGDLAIEMEMEVLGQTGEAVMELVKAGRLFRCTFNLADGKATLSISDRSDFHPTAVTPVRGPGKYHIVLTNVDNQLLLWVNGNWPRSGLVAFDVPTTYDSADDDRPDSDCPQQADLSPVGVASRGAALRVNHLKIFRDLYYIAEDGSNGMSDFAAPYSPYRPLSPDSVALFMSTPDMWEAFQHRGRVDRHLDADQFLVLGDNSAESKDSRLWGREYYVKRELLIGKALFIYWPHSWDEVPKTRIPFPFFPNFARMGFVR